MINELIALIIRETGWSLEYVRSQPFWHLRALADALQYARSVEAYERAYNAALIVCTLASSRTRRYKPEDIIGELPQRRDMTKRNLAKQSEGQTVTLGDGQEYRLPVLNLNVLADLEDEFGCGLEEISNQLQTRQASSLRKTLYILLHRGYPDITPDKIGELVSIGNLETVAASVAKALSDE